MTNLEKLTDDLSIDNFNKMEDQLTNQAERLNKLMHINKELIEKAIEFNSINNAANNTDYIGRAIINTEKNISDNIIPESQTEENNEKIVEKKSNIDLNNIIPESQTEENNEKIVEKKSNIDLNNIIPESQTEENNEENYSPTADQKKQVDAIKNKISKDETKSKLESVNIKLSDIIPEEKKRKKTISDNSGKIAIDLSTLSSKNKDNLIEESSETTIPEVENSNDKIEPLTEEGLEAEKLLNEAKNLEEETKNEEKKNTDNNTSTIDISKIM